MAQAAQPRAAAVDEQWPDTGQGQRDARQYGDQRAPFRRADHGFAPRSRQAAEAEGKGRRRADQRTQTVGRRHRRIEAVHEANAEHDKIRPDWIEGVQTEAVAQRAKRREDELGALYRQDRGLKHRVADTNRISSSPGWCWRSGTSRHRTRWSGDRPETRRPVRYRRRAEPEQRRGNQAAGKRHGQQRGGGTQNRPVRVVAGRKAERKDRAHPASVCPKR